ncbi:hypothetical protein [Streptomyces albicerus]|uniref:hypothetical protein n=1 Tax=Streptomyces albicerus TaxID=2569859 RepID=UPI00124BA0B0|nr:hypothetical protein [Streptomyces albicerus]
MLLTHLLTRARDRRHKVWDRKMDTYKLLLRSRRDFAYARSQFLKTGNNPAELINAERELKEMSLIAAELEMFGSSAVNAINLETNIAFGQWAGATAEWRRLNSSPSADTEAHRKADEKWEDIERLTENADLIDERLAEAIKAEANFKVPFKLERWRNRIKGRFVKR